jgi:hypothetical protein
MVVAAGSLWSDSVLACKVTHVDLWVGKDILEAVSQNTDPVYECRPGSFGWYVEWQANQPDQADFEFRVKDLSSPQTLQKSGPTPAPMPWHRNASGEAWWYPMVSAGAKTTRVWVAREGTSWFKGGGTRTVTVVEVDDVTSLTDVECMNTNVTFDVVTSPAGHYDLVQWSGGGTPATASGTGTFTTQWSSPGTKTVWAKCGGYQCDSGCYDTKNVSIVKAYKIQYDDPDTGWKDITAPLVVHKGTSVTFKAIPLGSASWPTGKPVWGGTSGASGTGSTTNVTFNTLSTSSSDYKTVTAECGNTVTINVLVFNFEGTLTPEDDFDGRSSTQYGIAEEVHLSFSSDPTGFDAYEVGGLEWTRTGFGTVSDAGNDGEAHYDAGGSPGNSTLYLTIQSGPSKGDEEDYPRTIVAPDSSSYLERIGVNLRHVQNSWSVGFRAYGYLAPKDVSFTNLEFREGTCKCTATGWLSDFDDEIHPEGSWVDVLDGDIATGSQFNGIDQIYAQSPPDPGYGTGNLNWPIPWEYRIGTGSPFNLDTANHHMTSDSSGTATLEKNGAGPASRVPSDPTSWWD